MLSSFYALMLYILLLFITFRAMLPFVSTCGGCCKSAHSVPSCPVWFYKANTCFLNKINGNGDKGNSELATYSAGKHIKHKSTETPPIDSFVVTTVYHNLWSPDNKTSHKTSHKTRDVKRFSINR